MNTDRYKPFTYHQKKMRLYRGAFIISGDPHNEHFCDLLQCGEINSDSDAIEYIDTHGEWLD